MKKNSFYIMAVILMIAGACNNNIVKKVNYCGFNYTKLTLDSNCTSNLKINADYLNDRLNSLDFYSFKKLIKKDTVITTDNTGFFISQTNLLLNNIIRVSTILNDTTRTFVFFKRDYDYELAMLESNYGDYSVKVQLFINSGFTTNSIRQGTVDSLKEYYKYTTPLPYDYLMINYSYANNVLQYKVLEAHSNLRGLGGSDHFEKIFNHYYCIYLDMELIEDRSTLYIYKQLNGLTN